MYAACNQGIGLRLSLDLTQKVVTNLAFIYIFNLFDCQTYMF